MSESADRVVAGAGSVLLVSNGFQPNYEAAFANALCRNGVDVTLVASDESLTAQLASSMRVLNLRGSQDARRPAWRKALNLLSYLVRLWLLAWRRGGVVQMIGLSAFANFRGTWAVQAWVWECRLLKLAADKLVLTVHNVVPHDRDTAALRQSLAALYRVPDVLVVHTLAARRRLEDEFGIASDRIHVMEHGLDDLVVRSPEEIAATRASLGYGSAHKVVLFLGWVRRYKGVDLLLDACADLPPSTRVLIAGNCIDLAYKDQIEHRIESRGLREMVRWEFGYLAEERVSALLSAADVLVMPYRHIDQSGVLFAALSHGVPVVAFDVGSLREYLPPGTGQIVPRGDVPALARALRDVAPAAAAREAVFAVARRYLWADTVKPVLRLYRIVSPAGVVA